MLVAFMNFLVTNGSKGWRGFRFLMSLELGFSAFYLLLWLHDSLNKKPIKVIPILQIPNLKCSNVVNSKLSRSRS